LSAISRMDAPLSSCLRAIPRDTAKSPKLTLELFYELLYIRGNRASGRHGNQFAPNHRARRLERLHAGERTAEMTVPAPLRVMSMPSESVPNQAERL
jgi:hypothetical protein